MTRRAPFVMVPRDLVYSGLPPRAQRLWMVLDDLARSDAAAAVSQAELAGVLGLTDRQIRRLTAVLVEAGWLATHRVNHYGALHYEPLRRARPVDKHRTPMSGVLRSAPDADVRCSRAAPLHRAHEEEEGRGLLGVVDNGGAARRPPWCGSCSEPTRLVEVGDRVARCPSCHPLTVPAF